MTRFTTRVYNKAMQEDLLKLGFSEHEASIYLALLDVGQTGAGAIIKRTGLHRNIVYETLNKLISKKLVIKVLRKNVAQFRTTDPSRITAELQSNLTLAEDIIPKLMKRSKSKNDIIIWDGIEGFRNYSIAMLEKMPKGTILHVLGSVGDRWYNQLGDKYYKAYVKLTRSRNIRWKMVTFEKGFDLDIKAMKETGLVEVRSLPQTLNAPANMLIWGDHIALQTFSEPYTVIEIQNKALAEAYLNYFNALWAQGKDIK